MLNRFKTAGILGLLTVLFLFVGNAPGGTNWLIIGIFLALALNFGSYLFSDRLVLRIHRAEPMTKVDSNDLLEMARKLSKRAEIPRPEAQIIPENKPNALAPEGNPANGVVSARY